MDIALLVLRVVFGLLFVGHGAQKLFGWFGGHGLAGTAGWLGSLNLKPAGLWAFAAGASEFFGGLLLILGFLNPLGPLAIVAAMAAATILVHLGKGFWAVGGGYEMPLALGTVAVALIFAGPGAYSLDALLDVSVPAAVSIAVALAVGGAVVYLLLNRRGLQSAGTGSEA